MERRAFTHLEGDARAGASEDAAPALVADDACDSVEYVGVAERPLPACPFNLHSQLGHI
jgi:hypothetical protein